MGVKVILINGYGRSGSTLLEKFVAKYKQVICVGELRNIWERACNGYRCSCGEKILECEYWREKIKKTLNVDEPFLEERVAEVSGLFKRVDRIRNFGRFDKIKERERCVKIQEDLYGEISQNGKKVVFDTSKNPSYSDLISSSAKLDIINFQLVRHPMAVVYSWKRKKLRKESSSIEYMPVQSAFESSLLWVVMNEQARRLNNVTVLRYEDFVKNPDAELDRISKIGDLDNISSVDEIVEHTVGGNPVKFQEGPLIIREDNEWENKMQRKDRVVASIICGGFMKRYKYNRNGVGRDFE